MNEPPVAPKNLVMRLDLYRDGVVEVWLDQGRPAKEVAGMLRELADEFEDNPKRIS